MAAPLNALRFALDRASLHPPPLVIDEVQYAPGLFRHVKRTVDANRHSAGQFILTGSQKFSLMREVSDSLAGRAVWLELEGLSASELRAGGVSARQGDELRDFERFVRMCATYNGQLLNKTDIARGVTMAQGCGPSARGGSSTSTIRSPSHRCAP